MPDVRLSEHFYSLVSLLLHVSLSTPRSGFHLHSLLSSRLPRHSLKGPNMARGGWIAYLKKLQGTRAKD